MLLVFTGSLTLNIYLKSQTGVFHYVTSFYRKYYPEHLPGTSNIVGNTSMDFQVDVQGKTFCKN
jgi:hypothetical protein